MGTETIRRKKRHYTKQEREQILSAYRTGSQTQKAFCLKAGISVATLGLWLSQSRRADKTGELLEVSLPEVASQPPALEIRFPGPIVMQVAAGTPAGWLREIVEALRCGA